MSIKINIPSSLQYFTNNMELVEVNGSTVGECLNNLTKHFPGIEKMLFDESGDLHNYMLNYVTVYINGEDAYPNELVKPVKDGDELHIIYMVGGG